MVKLFIQTYVLHTIFNFVQSIVNKANKISNNKATKNPPAGDAILSIGPCNWNSFNTGKINPPIPA